MSWTRNHRQLMDWSFDILGALIQAVGVWCFVEPCRIAPGGASGFFIDRKDEELAIP